SIRVLRSSVDAHVREGARAGLAGEAVVDLEVDVEGVEAPRAGVAGGGGDVAPEGDRVRLPGLDERGRREVVQAGGAGVVLPLVGAAGGAGRERAPDVLRA